MFLLGLDNIQMTDSTKTNNRVNILFHLIPFCTSFRNTEQMLRHFLLIVNVSLHVLQDSTNNSFSVTTLKKRTPTNGTENGFSFDQKLGNGICCCLSRLPGASHQKNYEKLAFYVILCSNKYDEHKQKNNFKKGCSDTTRKGFPVRNSCYFQFLQLSRNKNKNKWQKVKKKNFGREDRQFILIYYGEGINNNVLSGGKAENRP